MSQMMTLKNVKVLKKNGLEEFPAVEVRYDDKEVFANLPIALIPYGTEYQDPILGKVTEQGFCILMEREDLKRNISESKIYYFKLGEKNELIECTKEQSTTMTRLPLDFDVSKLVYINGEVLILDEEEKKEEEING